MTKYRPAEQKVKRTVQVFLFRFIGIRRQTMIAGFVNILGYIFIGATLKYKMVIIPALSFIFLIGLPYGKKWNDLISERVSFHTFDLFYKSLSCTYQTNFIWHA